jgi:uncharacterized cofD-like protein
MASQNVVVIGGGTGTFPVISALKQENVELTSIIAVSDSGGSTGRIRDEFGFQPVGDLRQALAALAQADGEEWIRKILLYRFEKGDGLKGHNLGNLILTALQDMTGDTTLALEIAEKVFRLRGEVVPATKDNVHLEIHFADGSVQVGEHTLDEETTNPKKITHVNLIPSAHLNPKAEQAILEAELIVIGPGDYYASIMAALLPEGMKAAFAKTSAKIVYMVNLMTRLTQTHEMTAAQHLTGIEEAIGRPVDHIVIHADEIPAETITAYAAHHEFPVVDDLEEANKVIRASLISKEVYQKSASDTAHRSLLRHDPAKVRQVLAQLLTTQAA